MEDWTISSESDDDEAELFGCLAYSMGAILGDGSFHYSIKRNQPAMKISTMDSEVVHQVAGEINLLFGTEYKVHSTNKYSPKGTVMYRSIFSRSDIVGLFYYMTNGRNEIPKVAFSASPRVKRFFIAGMMDTDGSVTYQTITVNGIEYPRWKINFNNTKEHIVRGLATLMQSLGVKVGKISKMERGNYNDRYDIHPNIRSYIDAGCFFFVKRKHDRLNAYLRHVTGSETMYTAPTILGEDIVQP